MRQIKKLFILTFSMVMLWGSMLAVQASSFNFKTIAEKEEVSKGETVKIDMQVSHIDAKDGINVIEADLAYDKTVFESVDLEGENQWEITYHAGKEKGKGKLVATKLTKGVTEEEKIGQIQLKVKDKVEKTETKVRLSGIVSNDGKELIEEENKEIAVKIAKEGQNGANNDSNAPVQSIFVPNDTANARDTEGPKTMDSITGDNVKTGDIVGIIILVAIVLLGINLIYFGVKAKQIKEDEEKREKYKKRLMIAVAVSIVLMIAVVFLAKNVIAYEGKTTEEIVEELKKQNEDNPESTKYLVTNNTISRIPIGTTEEMLEDEIENIEIEENEEETETDLDSEFLKTGMKVTYEENGRTYEISVLGDVNGDGIFNQIDVTKTIREYLAYKDSRLEKESEKLAADVTYDKKIDEKDIDIMIEGLFDGKLEVATKEIQKIDMPKVEIIEGAGKDSDQGRYFTKVSLKITQENKASKTARTTYKITGTKETEEKKIKNTEEVMELKEPGVYRVTAYTYGKEGNKSKGSYAIFVIEEAPKVKVDVNVEGETKGPIKVSIEEKEGYEVEYKIGDGEWVKYEKEFEIDENTTITTRFVGEEGEGAESKTEITNIDNLPPKPFTPKVTTTSNSMTVTGSTTDATATDKSACSGIAKYYYSKDNGTTWEPVEGTTDTTYTFDNLGQNQTYQLKMKAVDKVGNETITETITKTTDKIPSLTQEPGKENVTFNYSPSSMTKDKVTVTISTTVGNGYTLQYTTENPSDESKWVNYPATGVTFQNNGLIYVRVSDGKAAGGYVIGKVSNIDNLAPNAFTPTATSTTNSITLTGNTSDAATTGESACSGIDKYYYSKDNGSTWEPTEGTTNNSYTFNGLIQNQNYNLKMKAVDKAGNEVITETVSKATESIPTLTDEEGKSNITFNYTPSEITKENVVVTITTTVGNGYTLQYTTDNPNDESKWKDYQAAGVTFQNNGSIYVRLKDSTGQVGEKLEGKVTNIDKLAPNAFIPTTTSTTNSITVTGNTTDAEAIEASACSGIDKYYFSKDNGTTWEPTDGVAEQPTGSNVSYTFNNLTQNQEYNLKMKAVDKVGNEVITETVTETTKTMPGLTDEEGRSNVTFTSSPSTMTKENVVVTIITTVGDGYTLQYATNDSSNEANWQDYPTTGVIFQNNGNIYARLSDGTNKGDYVTKTVSNIDKVAPNTFTPTATSTTNSITLTGETTDAEETEESACSGMDKYYYSKDNGSTWEPTEGTTNTSYTFNDLTQNQDYNLKMKAVDKVGNETITEAISKATTEIPGLTNEEGKENVSFNYTPSEMTNGDVVVTITTTVGDGYTLQYATTDPSNEANWIDYPTEGVTFTNNGNIYTRLSDGTNGGTYVSKNITNIDKLAPNTFMPTAASTTNSITLTGKTTDATATKENACSGIDKYYFSKDNGTTWEPTEGITEQTTGSDVSYIFNNLTQNQTYQLKMKVTDKVGNETITETVSKATTTIPGLTDEEGRANVTFTSTPSTMTNGDVTVTIATTVGEGYTLQYATNDPSNESNWVDYQATGVTFQNNGNLYARLSDGINGGTYVSKNITNIDKLAPKIFAPTVTSTTNSITLTGSTTDAEETEQNACSGIAKYYYSKDNGTIWEPTDGTTNTTYTFSNLTQSQFYSLKMKVVDNVGNEMITETITQTTKTIPGLTDEEGRTNVTFTYSPSEMTNEDVEVRIKKIVGDEYTLQYTTEDPSNESNWIDYQATGITFENNGSIYARLKDSTGQVGETIEGKVTNIDKILPTAMITAETKDNDSIELNIQGQDETVAGIDTIKLYKKKVDQEEYECLKTYEYKSEEGKYDLKEENYTLENLQVEKGYDVYIEVKDRAENMETYRTNIWEMSSTKDGSVLAVLSHHDGIFRIIGTGESTGFSGRESDIVGRPWHGMRESIKKVIINEGITVLGQRLFFGCTNLESLEIPSTLRKIGVGTLQGNINLTDIKVNSDSPYFESENGILFNKGKTEIMSHQAVKECYIVPDSIIGLADGTFASTQLTGIELNNHISRIRSFTFAGCTLLTNIEIPNSVTRIDEWSFSGCTNLTKIKIPSSVTFIADSAFRGCLNLTIQCESGSYADTFAQNNNIAVEYINE